MTSGRPLGTKTPILERLLNRIIVNETTGCWEWQGAKNNIGYGFIRDTDVMRMRTTHRVSYEEHVGQIPKGLCVLHSCDNRACVNPNHLRLGTHLDNARDMQNRGRAKYGNASRLGTKHKLGTCMHCGAVKPVNTLSRWHNDNCKHKPLSINTTYNGQASP